MNMGVSDTTKAADPEKKGAKPRVRVALSFSAEEFQEIRQKAGATPPSTWCKERVLLSRDFADPLAGLISQGLLAAAGLRQHQPYYIRLFELGYQLTEAIHRRPLDRAGDEQVRDLANRLESMLDQLSTDREKLITFLKELMRAKRTARGKTV